MTQSNRFLTLGLVALLFATVAIAPEPAAAQDQDAPAVTTPEEPGDTPEADADQPPVDTEGDAPPPADDGSDEAPAEVDETPADVGQEAPDTAEEGTAPASDNSGRWLALLAVLAVIVIPIPIGTWLAKQFKMDEHGWKFSLVIGSIAAAALAVATGEFKGGPDLSGGITLIYQLENPEELINPDDPDAPVEPIEGRKRVDMQQLIDAIKQRVDPAGTKEVSIRQYGTAIEVIIPKQGEADLKYIKELITDLGNLEFRILADERWDADKRLIDKAMLSGPSQTIVELDGAPAGKWAPYDEENGSFGPPEAPADGTIKRRANGQAQILVKLDRMNVTGEYLDRTFPGIDEDGAPAVHFVFDSRGAKRFKKLTGDNRPNAATGLQRRLGVLLDREVRSAPGLRTQIERQGIINGMEQQEVNKTVGILNAGSLPAALDKNPISENIVSPTLGKLTVEQGKRAIAVSLGAVLVFMALYYRFAGLVACLALAFNLLLVLGVMVVLKAAFTLPGLAGLVLTVGMSVDANVLIFERIREELGRGASLRMAIRNGFGRATTTIVDANVTTLITGVVLYAIGTDQIKGFAVTLVIGILASMYTAIFASRLVFDVAERRRWIKDLKFSRIIGETRFDFIGKRYAALALSAVVIAAGLLAVASRGVSLLDIDFTGGSSVTMVLDEKQPSSQADVVKALRSVEVGGGGDDNEGDAPAEFGEQNLTVVEVGETGTRFTVTCSVDDPEQVKQALAEAFGDALKTYAVDISEARPFEEGGLTGAEIDVTFNDSDGLAHDALLARVRAALAEAGHEGMEPRLTAEGYQPGSNQHYNTWTLRFGGLAPEDALAVAEGIAAEMRSEPVFPLANKIGGRVAGDMRWTALNAMGVSLLGIVGYVWLRFQNIAYGFAAVAALVHDVLVTVGAIALSFYVASGAPPLASAIQVDAFQISLTIVAALLTIIGYSLNDTIVIFDRIREVKGKSPRLTADMINLSVNQTLSRTLLTSLTTLIVVGILYFMGGDGIHGFAFALVIGVISGTYSTVFVAAPLLLSLAGVEQQASTPPEVDEAA